MSTWAWPLWGAEDNSTSAGKPLSQIIFGGSEVQLYLLAQKIVEDKRFEVSFIVGDFGQVLKESYQGIKLLKGLVPASSSTDRRPLLNIKKYLRPLPNFSKLWQALKKADAHIYIQRGAGAETGIIAFFCKLYRRKFVYMVASDIDISGEYVQKNALRGNLFKWGLTQAHQVIVQHHQQRGLLQKNFHRDGILIKTGYDIEPTETVQKEFILWIARGERGKKPELFLELARVFPDKSFKMICNCVDREKEFFNNLKTTSRQIPNLEFIEYVPFNQVDQYFRHAKVLVNTSEYEGFPNTFIQAAKNKTPLLSYKVNPDNFIHTYQLGYCADGDFSKLVEQLRDLLYNQANWIRMSENAFRYAKENHDINKIIPQFKNLLLSLIN